MRSQVQDPFLKELWQELRPYLLCVMKDYLIVLVLWLSLWAFVGITKIFRIDGRPAEYIHNIHTTGTVLLFALLTGLLVLDIWELYVRTRKERMMLADATLKKRQAEAMTP